MRGECDPGDHGIEDLSGVPENVHRETVRITDSATGIITGGPSGLTGNFYAIILQDLPGSSGNHCLIAGGGKTGYN